MKVLGISPLDKDSTVTIVEDGVITYAAAEERFTRVKLQDGFPWRALENALEKTGSTMAEFDRVVYPFLTYDEETTLFERNLQNERDFLDETEANATQEELRAGAGRACRPRARRFPGLAEPNERYGEGPAEDAGLSRARERRRRVAQRRQARAPRSGAARRRSFTSSGSRSSRPRSASSAATEKLKRVEHHLSHAANAYYKSGFDEALVVTLDGYGSGLAGQHQRRPRRQDRAPARSGVPALARHVLRVGDVGARLHAEPARREDRRSRRLRRSVGPRRPAAAPLRPEERRLPHRRDEQRLLRAAARDALPEDRRRGGVSARARGSRDRVRLAVHPEDRPAQSRAVGRRRRQRQAEPAPARDQRRRGHLHPPEHGRRRLRHGRGAARVRRHARSRARRCTTSTSGRSSRAPRSPRRSTARSCRSPSTSRSSRRSRCCSPPARSSRASTGAWSTARARSATGRSCITRRNRP